MLATGWGFPGVILNFATAYLRMMVPNPVVAKERGMKQKRNSSHYKFTKASLATRYVEQSQYLRSDVGLL
jgi:hypothetical protein